MPRLVVTLLLALICATPAVAASAAAPPENLGPPTIDDTSPAVGDRLHAGGDAWDDPEAIVTYQWRRCGGDGACADIPDATGGDYTVVPADARSRLQVRATATNADGPSAPSDSQLTDPVADVPPQNTTPPSISGTPRSGETLTAHDGAWSGTSPTISRQWLRCDAAGAGCVEISGATGPTLVLGGADEGHTIRVRVTASNGAGEAGAQSDPTALVTVVPVPVSNVSPPLIAGAPAVGSTLISTIGRWGGTIPIVLTRRWQRCSGDAGTCVDIPRQVSDTYTVVPADLGHSIRIVVIASNVGGTTTAASALLGPITSGAAGPAPQATAAAPLAASFAALRRADLARALRGRLRLRARCTGPCRIVVRLTGSQSVARKWRVPRTLATGRRTLAGAGTAIVRPRFAKSTRRRLGPVKKLVVVVTAQARDGAGKLVAQRSWKLTLTLTRRTGARRGA